MYGLNTMNGMLSLDNMFVRMDPMRDITKDANGRFFRSIPGGHQTDLKHCCIVGKPGCGKTLMLNYRLWMAYQIYGQENVNPIFTDDPRIFMDMIDSKPVQYALIDDATSNASSRTIHDNTDILITYNKCRHVHEGYLGGRPGLELFDWSWQRWIELDPGFRDGHLLIFKTGMTGRSERMDIEDKIGETGVRYLYRIWDKIDQGDNEIKSKSVARIASKSIEGGGVGIYSTPSPDSIPYVLPEFIKASEYGGTDEVTAGAILDELRNKPKWSQRVKIYEMYMETDEKGKRKYTQSDLAEEFRTNQGRISEAVRKVQGEIGRT